MRVFVIAIAALSLTASLAPVSHAAVGCTLDDPAGDLARFFPDFSDFSIRYLSFATQDPAAHAELAKRLDGTLDPVYEAADVPYALYTVNRDGERLGYVFGTNQRGTYSNIQVVAVTNAALDLQTVYIQKLRSPDHALLQGDTFTAALARIPLPTFPEFAACFDTGRCDDVPVTDPTDGRQAEDFRAILRALAKLHHVQALLLRPGAVPRYRDPRALAEYIDTFWVPEQGFMPFDSPPKVPVGRADPHIVGPDALVAALPGRDRVTLYPLSLLTTHPVIQDDLDGRVVTLAWSSPSHTLTVFAHDGASPLRFSNTSNLLFGHQTVLERTTRIEWSPLLGRPVSGPETARHQALTHVPGAILLPWATARALFPGGLVAVPSDPYSRHKSFYEAHRARFDAPGRRSRVVVLTHGTSRAAVRAETLAIEPFLTTRVGSVPVLLVSDAGGRAAYRTTLDGRPLTFTLHIRDTETGAGLLRDRETESTWEALTGRAIAGPLAGAALEPVVFHEMPEETAAALFPRLR